MPEIFEHIDQLGRAPGRVAVATLVNTRGTTPRKEGAKMLVGEGFGAEARDAMAAGLSRTLVLEGVRAFLEVIAPPALLLVVGASHVAMPLTTLARTLGYHTVVMDGRPRFATRERFADVDELRIGIPSEMIREHALTP